MRRPHAFAPPPVVVPLLRGPERVLSDQEILELTYITCIDEFHTTMSHAPRLEYDDIGEWIVEVPASDDRATFDVMADISRRQDRSALHSSAEKSR